MNENNCHDTDMLANGTRIGKRGATWQILDNDGEPVSDGFHEIWWNNGEYRGELGAMEYVIDLDGKTITQGFHELQKDGDNYKGKTGASEYRVIPGPDGGTKDRIGSGSAPIHNTRHPRTTASPDRDMERGLMRRSVNNSSSTNDNGVTSGDLLIVAAIIIAAIIVVLL